MAAEQCTADVVAKREAFLAEIHACDPERLIFIDESGSHIAMTRTRAWAPRGRRAFGRVPRNRGRVTTMLAALSIDGIEAMMTVQGGTTAPVFLKFLDEQLVPKLRPGDVVVMDNLGAHHAHGVRERIEAVEMLIAAIVTCLPTSSTTASARGRPRGELPERQWRHPPAMTTACSHSRTRFAPRAHETHHRSFATLPPAALATAPDAMTEVSEPSPDLCILGSSGWPCRTLEQSHHC